MRTDELSDFADLLAGVMDLYGKPTSEFATQVWWEAMRPYDLPAVRLAFSRHVQNPDTGQFAPKPADLVRVLRGTTADRSLVAWGKVLDAMQRVGAYRSVVFDDGAIHAAISDMGRQCRICRGNFDDDFEARPSGCF